jgi:hypothetical protein
MLNGLRLAGADSRTLWHHELWTVHMRENVNALITHWFLRSFISEEKCWTINVLSLIAPSRLCDSVLPFLFSSAKQVIV